MNEVRQKRRSARWEFRNRLRRESAISEYLRISAPQLHNEAVLFFNNIQHLYPAKKDLRKTPEFKAFQQSKLSTTTEKGSKPARKHNQFDKQMLLNIELFTQNEKTANNSQDRPVDPESEQSEIISTSILNDSEWEQLNAAFRDIPQDTMNQMLNQINDDPDLKDILDQFNFHGDDDDLLDVDIDIDTETELEKELSNL